MKKLFVLLFSMVATLGFSAPTDTIPTILPPHTPQTMNIVNPRETELLIRIIRYFEFSNSESYFTIEYLNRDDLHGQRTLLRKIHQTVINSKQYET